MKKYDVIVTDGKNRRQEIGMMANNINELKGYVAMSDESIVQILREYEDEDCKNYGKFNPQEILSQMNTPMAKGTGTPGLGYMRVDLNSEDFKKQIESLSKSNQEQPGDIKSLVEVKNDPVVDYTANNSEKPRYFNIGSVECKIEKGKVYQKQWMRLTDDEMKELRLVSDKNNKIIPIKDKHIEMMKWVMTEENEENV